MNEASFEGFIRVILIFLLIYFGIKIIIRYFGPAILRYIMKRIGKSMSKRFYESQNQRKQQSREGEVTIDKKPPKGRKSNNDVGEYVDYEEID